jgi:hypothetical protein
MISSSPAALQTIPQPAAFKAPAIVSAGDVQYPLNTMAAGIIVFNVSLSATGKITNVNALTDIPPLTATAQSALRSWKFAPASLAGVPEPSQMMVAVVFRHGVQAWSPPVFNPVFASKERAGFIPAGILAATYSDYPASTIAASTTVVQVTVKADGIIDNLSVVRGINGGFVPLAQDAAKQWQFQPAALDGTPVASKVAIAFVFSSRALDPF